MKFYLLLVQCGTLFILGIILQVRNTQKHQDDVGKKFKIFTCYPQSLVRNSFNGLIIYISYYIFIRCVASG